MKTINKIIIAALVFYTSPVFAQAYVPYTPYSTVQSSGPQAGGGYQSAQRQAAPGPSYGQPEQYLGRNAHHRYGSTNGTGNGAHGWDGKRYVPAGPDPNQSPDVYGE